jgi:Zn-dependent protease
MPWSLYIGKVGGTEIRIHVTFLLFLAWLWAASYMSGGADAAWSGLIFTVLLFLCVLVHEYGHILTARAFGISTRDVSLLPIGGVARLERFPEESREEFLIAIAGPMVNVAIALALMLATPISIRTSLPRRTSPKYRSSIGWRRSMWSSLCSI